MPTLQVREVPDVLYGTLAEEARRERRSLTQQALVTLKRGLGMAEEDAKQRRQNVLAAIETEAEASTDNLPGGVEMVREDRNR